MSGLEERLRKLKKKAISAFVQECPPELYACEVCGELRCNSERWLNCKKRLAAAEYLRSGENKALGELKKKHSTSRDVCFQRVNIDQVV